MDTEEDLIQQAADMAAADAYLYTKSRQMNRLGDMLGQLTNAYWQSINDYSQRSTRRFLDEQAQNGDKPE